MLLASGVLGLIVYLAACHALKVRELGRFAWAIIGRD